ncbi:MAG: hypothetical protein JWL85_454 [Candidatus Saccharibacteria bacterium]|nr:hypothetical protein [Candidatus Saccharibacteria bacterium]
MEIDIRSNTTTVSHRLTYNQTTKAYKRAYSRLFKRSRKRLVRYSLLTANMALLLGVIAFVVNNPGSSQSVRQTSSSILGSNDLAENPLDQLSSADIAVHVSRVARMGEAVAVANQADSETTQLTMTAADTSLVAKPQVVKSDTKSARDIRTYKTAAGDTIDSLAAKFGITSDSIRWSNGLTSNNLSAGKELLIPPVNGVVYTVKSGDTAENLAQKYSSSKEAIIVDNDAEVAGLKVGQRILIRGGLQPVARAAASYSYFSGGGGGFSFGSSAIYGYNGYDFGYCTWYVANKRISIGRALPANLGDAWTWDDRAAAAGIPVSRTPSVGDAVVTGSTRRPGHVAYVERINPDGSIWISEMNSSGQKSIDDPTPYGGWGKTDFKLIPADRVSSYNYIH